MGLLVGKWWVNESVSKSIRINGKGVPLKWVHIKQNGCVKLVIWVCIVGRWVSKSGKWGP